jgi:hypothetical protein
MAGALLQPKELKHPCEDCGGKIIATRESALRCDGCKTKRRRAKDARRHIVTRRTSAYRQKYRAWSIQKRYGISQQEFEALFESQGRCCAICRSVSPGSFGKHWSVDHDHDTGQVRGILCHPCNLMLGLAKDDIGRLQQADNYLTRSLLK